MTTPTSPDLATEALALLAEALDIFHEEHELCDEVSSREWLWRWRTLTLLDDADGVTCKAQACVRAWVLGHE